MIVKYANTIILLELNLKYKFTTPYYNSNLADF